MIYITGDTHGLRDLSKFQSEEFLKKINKKGNYVIITGDAGITWNQDTMKKCIDFYSKFDCEILFTSGLFVGLLLLVVVLLVVVVDWPELILFEPELAVFVLGFELVDCFCVVTEDVLVSSFTVLSSITPELSLMLIESPVGVSTSVVTPLSSVATLDKVSITSLVSF